MARMIPPAPVGECPPGEREVFRCLKALPDDWSVLHSLVFSYEHGRDAEADFVVVTPSGDCIVIEVKSHHRIEYRDGLWRGNGKEITDPFRQVRDVFHRLRKWMQDSAAGRVGGVIARLVIFPFASFAGRGPELKEWEYVAAEEWQGISGDNRKFEQRLAALIAGASDRGVPAGSRDRVSVGVADELVKRLRPCLKSNARVDLVRLRDGELAKAMEEQREALGALEYNDRCLVVGPAGTGKTLLAQQRFVALVKDGSRPILLCYNRLIADEIRAVVAGQVPGHRGLVMTVHAAMRKIVGDRFEADFDDPDWGELSMRAMEVLIESGGPFGPISHLVVDEAQDLALIPDFLDLAELLLGRGLSQAKWAFFGDFETQVIYKLPGTSEDFLQELKRRGLPAVLPLKHNCRNTRPMLAPVGQALPEAGAIYRGFRRQDSKVEDCKAIYNAGGTEGFFDALKAALRHCSECCSRTESTVILFRDSPSSAELDVLKRVGVVDWVDSRGNSHKRVRWTTIRKAKGLEFDGVVVVGTHAEGELLDAQLLYTACTRALTCVVVIQTE
jgi:hypothetical protein